MATKTIGPTGDYTTLALYAAYLDTLNALAAPEIGKIQAAGVSVSSSVNFTGFTPTSTNTWTLQADDGASFRENANAATNALRFSTANGAYIDTTTGYATAISVGVPWVIIKDLQFRQQSTIGQGLLHMGSSGNQTIEECIFDGKGVSNDYLIGWSGGSNHTIQNFLIVSQTANYHFPILIGGASTLINGTIVRPSNLSPNNASNDRAISTFYAGPFTITNVVAYNFSQFSKPQIGTPTLSGTNNATDLASYPSGLSGEVSLTAATEFEEPSNASSLMDWRLASTSVKCLDNGTNTGAPTTDIIGQSISNTTRDVGAWEFVAAGGGTTDAVGSASGTGAASGVGASTAASTASASGAGAASGVGASTAAAAGSASGAGVASGVGASVASAVGSVSGTSTAEAVGSSTTSGSAVGTAAGSSVASGVGASVVAAVGGASGSATVVGISPQVATGSTAPDGAPGHRIKFRGRLYDSKRDRYRLAKDVEAFLAEKQEEAPQPQEKPRKRVIRTEVAAIPAPQVVLDTTEIDELTEVLTALKARDGQLRSYVAQLKAMNETLMAEEEEFLMMVA